MKDPDISVCMISYNHGNFIAQAIESILKQKINRSLELVIGEDLSTDGTREICEYYHDLYPDIIRILPQKERLGMTKNFFRTLLECRGKYIAICEGDDYWIDPFKLQKQYDFLENNSSFTLCFHNTLVIDEINNKQHLFGFYNKSFYDGYDLLKKWLFATSSAFFRNILEKPLPRFFLDATHPDLLLFLYLAERGKMAFINETMSVYRIHSGGITKNLFEKNLEHNLKHIKQIKQMKIYFDTKYSSLFEKRMSNYLLSTSYLFAKEKKKTRSCLFLRKYLALKKFSLNHFLILSKILFTLLTVRKKVK